MMQPMSARTRKFAPDVRAALAAVGFGVLMLLVATPVAGASRVIAAEVVTAAVRTTVPGTAGDDFILVAQLVDGSISVSVNGSVTVVPAASAGGLVVSALGGDDEVVADPSLTQGVAVLAGAGADRVVGGAGRDYVDGGAGPDVVDGGAGDDVLYGGSGADGLLGADDADYVDGGPGADVLSGGAGDDLLMGGRDDDELAGDDGDDLMAGGAGTDRYSGGAGVQRTFAQRSDVRPFHDGGTVVWVPQTVNVDGEAPGTSLAYARSSGFGQRLASDVQALLSLPIGRRMLSAIDAAGRRIGVTRGSTGNWTTVRDSAAAFLRRSGRRGPGSACDLVYDPVGRVIGDGAEAWMQRPPIVGLYHELVHCLNATTGSLQPGKTDEGVLKLELQAIGLTFDGIAWDHDGRPSTPRQSGNVRAFTENGLRSFFRFEARPRY
jgi:hypothetical protein